jgi:hypothetical protein
MLTVLLVLVSLLVVDLLFTRGTQLLTWVRSLDPVVTREVDTVNNDVVHFAVDTKNYVVSTGVKVAGDLEVAGNATVAGVVSAEKVVETGVSTAVADVKVAENAVSTVATDVAKEATVVVADVKKI